MMYDVVFLGASSYTGQLLIEEVARRYGFPRDSFQYALAGSDLGRLKEAEEKLLKITNCKGVIEKIVLDQRNPSEVRKLCESTKVICALKGPYVTFGETVVMICAETGTHYCDITGELGWVAQMRNKYDAIAKANKAVILPCCGFDYIPVDILFYLLQESAKDSTNDFPDHPKLHMDLLPPSPLGISGGTLRTILKTSFKSESDLWTPISEPVSNPETVKQSQQVWKPVEAPGLGWRIGHIMAPGMSKYCRWVNEINGFPMRKNLIVQTSMLLSSHFSALKGFFSLFMMMLFIMLISFIPPLANYFVPKQGAGPDKDTQLLGSVQIKASVNTNKEIHSSEFVFGLGGAYIMTAVSVLECSIGLSNIGGKYKAYDYGFSTPATAMKDQIIQRLNRQGFKATSSKTLTQK